MRKERPDYEQRNREAVELVEQGYGALLAELEQGKSDRLLHYLAFASRFHAYSPANQMLIFMQSPDAQIVAGYGRWMKEGSPVKKGEKGIRILAPLIRKAEDGEEKKVVGFKITHVFDVSQTTNPEVVPSFWHPLPDDAEEQYQLVTRVVQETGVRVAEAGDLPRGVRGQSHGGLVTVAKDIDTRAKTMVLVHEWAHEMIHRQEMTPEERKKTPRGTRECQAEAVSFIVSRYLGLENPFSSDYLQMWGNTTEDLARNMQVVQRTSQRMIVALGDGTTPEGETE